jgi:hypothetical protein
MYAFSSSAEASSHSPSEASPALFQAAQLLGFDVGHSFLSHLVKCHLGEKFILPLGGPDFFLEDRIEMCQFDSSTSKPNPASLNRVQLVDNNTNDQEVYLLVSRVEVTSWWCWILLGLSNGPGGSLEKWRRIISTFQRISCSHP